MHDSPVINHAGRLVSEIGVACSVLRFKGYEAKHQHGVLEDDSFFFYFFSFVSKQVHARVPLCSIVVWSKEIIELPHCVF